MDPAQIAQTILDIGGWGAFLLTIIVAALGIRQGWIVPGRYYDRELARADKAETEARKTAETLERLTISIDAIVEQALRSRRA